MNWLFQWFQDFDNAPAERRFQVMTWIVIASGAINMSLTIAYHFPFGLLVLLTIIVLAAWRRPDLGLRRSAGGGADTLRGRIDSQWLYDANQWYETYPEMQRWYIIAGALVAGGAVNMLFTIFFRFPFGLLELLVVLGMCAIRGPYVHGWVKVPSHLATAAAVALAPPPAPVAPPPIVESQPAPPAAAPEPQS